MMRCQFFIAGFAAVCVAAVYNAQSHLRKKIFANYDHLVKPDGQVELELGLTIFAFSYCPHKEVEVFLII